MTPAMMMFLTALAFDARAEVPPQIKDLPPVPGTNITATPLPRIINGTGNGEYVGPMLRKTVGDPKTDAQSLVCEISKVRMTRYERGSFGMRMAFSDLPKDLDMKQVGETIMDIYRAPMRKYVAEKPADPAVTIAVSYLPGLKEFPLYKHNTTTVEVKDLPAALDLAKLVSKLCGDMTLNPPIKIINGSGKPPETPKAVPPVTPPPAPGPRNPFTEWKKPAIRPNRIY